ncbi:MAG: CNP1-like family protein [Bacteroidota bacterium]
MKRAAILALVCVFGAAGCGGSKVRDVPDEESGDPRVAQESAVKLPPYPKEQDLLRFEIQPRTAFDYLVDGSSIAVLEEGEVRFAVVVRTANAVNVSYEGFRCISRERRVYARASRDGNWIIAKDGWVPVGPRPVAGFRHELYWNYFCPGKRIISSTREGVDALRFGGHRDARPEGSMAGND